MDFNKIAKFKLLFTGWTNKEINIAYQMLIFLKKADVTLEEFKQFADFLQYQTLNNTILMRRFMYLRIEFWKENSMKCPDCGLPMNLEPVNVSKCTRLKDPSLQSVWSCPDPKGCGHQLWNKKPVEFHQRLIMANFDKKYGSMSPEEILALDIDESKLNLVVGGPPKPCSGCKENK